jgi:hypothetical protein
MQIRRLHAYVGMFIAPTVFFLAATGLLQVYSLHEAHPGYTPPALIEMLSAVHKDQRFAMGHKEPPEAARPHAAGPASEPPHAERPRNAHIATTLLKAFFTLVALGLIFSTGAGIWMALQQAARRRTHLVLLATGTLVPVILAALTA